MNKLRCRVVIRCSRSGSSTPGGYDEPNFDAGRKVVSVRCLAGVWLLAQGRIGALPVVCCVLTVLPARTATVLRRSLCSVRLGDGRIVGSSDRPMFLSSGETCRLGKIPALLIARDHGIASTGMEF